MNVCPTTVGGGTTAKTPPLPPVVSMGTGSGQVLVEGGVVGGRLVLGTILVL